MNPIVREVRFKKLRFVIQNGCFHNTLAFLRKIHSSIGCSTDRCQNPPAKRNFEQQLDAANDWEEGSQSRARVHLITEDWSFQMATHLDLWGVMHELPHTEAVYTEVTIDPYLGSSTGHDSLAFETPGLAGIRSVHIKTNTDNPLER